jgi:hypothetical protein
MKKILLLVSAALALYAEDGSVTVSTETVEKTIKREPREVLFRFNRATGAVDTEITYESVVRVNGVPASWEPLKVVTLNWHDTTNSVPALTLAFEQFKAASKASLTNTP